MCVVVGLNEFVGLANGDVHCWLCQKPVSTRALFCNHCGTIQPVRDIDHFARLGLDRRIDVDMDMLERQYTALGRTLAPERFMIRGMGERGHAAKQLEALEEAYQTLRDPLRRGRYWLQLNQKHLKEDGETNALVQELRRELTEAGEPAACDRVAQKAGHALEQGVMMLMQALRGENWEQASVTLTQLDGVEIILNEVRSRRDGLTGSRD